MNGYLGRLRSVESLLSAGLAVAVMGFAGPVTDRGAPANDSKMGRCHAAPHRVDLEGTGRAPEAAGWMDLRFGNGPYGVAVTEDGSYRYRLSIHVSSVPPTGGRTLVAWAATPDLDEHVNLGPVGDDATVEGDVSWNKFLVFVTAEPSPDAERWQGPILMTGHSPSGNMHTMAGHGIFEQHGIGC